MVESLVSYQIIDYLGSHRFIWMDQSAYLKMHSTQTYLHRVIDDWLEHINDGEITGTCLLDISKCFDSINHIILLKKLEMYGIIGTELNWFSSYLNGRKQFVNFNNEISESCETTCGMWCSTRVSFWPYFVFIVHQWHLQFCSRRLRIKYVCRRCDNLYIRNVNARTKCKLQSCIDSISNWHRMNKLCINKMKSSVVVIGSKFQLRSLNLDDFAISVNVDKLQLVEQAKYLGLWVRNDLSWDDHILELCKKM